MAKVNKKWVVLCSTAIGAIYAAGYFTTETQASMLQPPQYNQVSIAAGSSQSYNQSNSQTNIHSSKQSSSQSKSQSNIQSKSQYKNGTFYGSGRNRRGSIQLAVSIKNDKITDVEISDFAMHYSEDDVVGLPQEVVQKQSAKVQNVSGATYSTQAFQDAVQDALSQARNS
ncbi:hypothetical protein Back11_14550 [Paenibacillus baekrokdamisoli]|uniref:Uncharacterized protein n=1 Tax=Paenibacillus baekrokdamisoli TaxID=1712516 RepID=A0A3G9IMP5_9BACL|nr:FMN-binding protein [Paenibacillus baekrokdamisoli]MBB3070760.1 uncharacterized protein with FMN-binding domain [Paenibacillus baekrokdamisoli]BBH20110.1 hypothetical protein Back11_14550 [Paenibacillus baekrokdamisoli]